MDPFQPLDLNKVEGAVRKITVPEAGVTAKLLPEAQQLVLYCEDAKLYFRVGKGTQTPTRNDIPLAQGAYFSLTKKDADNLGAITEPGKTATLWIIHGYGE